MCRKRCDAMVVLTALVLLCSSALAEGTGPVTERNGPGQQVGIVRYRQFAQARPGEVTGRALFPDLKTPAAKATVRVWNVGKREFVHTGSTDDGGFYRLPALEPGRYFVIFGDRVNVDLRVVRDPEVEGGPLNVIIPRGRTVFARMEPAQRSAVLSVLAATEDEGAEEAAEGPEDGGRIAGLPLKTVVLGVGGVGTAVAIVKRVSEGHHGDDERHIVSP